MRAAEELIDRGRSDGRRIDRDQSPAPRGGRADAARGRLIRIALLAAAIAAVVLLGREGASYIPRALEAVRGLGPWAALGFIGIYAVATVSWVPGSILTLAAGAVFGLLAGTVYTLVGATLGAALAFLVARHLARGAVERRLACNPRLRAVDEAVGRQAGKVVLLLRLSPIVPFNALNYALGLTSVRFRDYVLASAVGMAPGTFMYVYAGHAAGVVAEGAAGVTRGAGYYAFLGVGLLATVALTIVVTRAARRALRRSTAFSGGADELEPHR